MIYDMSGTSVTDPLYILLAREDKEAAETYAEEHSAGLMQNQLTSEQERGSIDFGEAPFSVDEYSVITTGTPDQVIDVLIAHMKKRKEGTQMTALSSALSKAGITRSSVPKATAKAAPKAATKPRRSRIAKQYAASVSMPTHSLLQPVAEKPTELDKHIADVVAFFKH